MDTSKYKGIFLQETRAHLSGIESGLLALEKDPSDKGALDALFRHYHSIKGMSASMGYSPLITLAHRQEDILDKLRSGKAALDKAMASALLVCLDALRRLVEQVEADEPLDSDIGPYLKGLSDAAEGKAPAGPGAGQQPTGRAAQGGSGLRLSGEMRVDGRLFDGLLATVGDMFMSLSSFRAMSHSSRSIEVKDGVHLLGKSINALHSGILSARMLPLQDLASGLPRLIRDLTSGSGKEVALNTENMDISLDRTILEGLASPLVHIIRNAVDHGIETAQERHGAGKLSVGSIRIRAHTRRDKAVIEVCDDGRGINRERLREKAVAKGILAARLSSMPDSELLQLVCVPGLSTAESVTDTSGRGVGMDVVKDAIEALGGTLVIESVEGKGTKIILELPRTTSITKALLVSVGQERFLLPLSQIERVIEAGAQELEAGSFDYNGSPLPVVPLWRLLGVAAEPRQAHTLVIVDAGQGRLVALMADDFHDELDAYVKPLAPPMSRLWGAAGLTIMGDGTPVFLLDVPQIISKALARA